MERTPEQMREYLDNWHHPPDPEQVWHYAEIWNWFMKQEDPDEPSIEPLSEEAKQAYIDEHFQVCTFKGCGQTREWHNIAARNHQFELE